MMKRVLLIIFLALPTLIASAGMNISAGNGPHTHADANTGGSRLSPSHIEINALLPATTEPALGINGLFNGNSVIQVNENDDKTGATNVLSSSLRLTRNGLQRWTITKHFAAETGSNVGSDLQILAINDAGTTTLFAWTFTRSTGATSFPGTVSSAKACASGYSRLTPNFCKHNSSGSVVLTNPGTTCTLSTALTGVSDAKAVDVLVTPALLAQNAVAAVAGSAQLFDQSSGTCAGNAYDTLSWTAYEFVATAGAVPIFQTTSSAVHVPTNTTGQFRAKQAQASTILTTTYRVMGYYD